MSETPGASQTPRPPIHRRRRSRRRIAVALVAVGLAGVLVAGAAVWTDTLGAGHLFDRAVAKVDRFLAGPVPDRSAPGTVLVTGPDPSDEPDDEDDPDASLGPEPSVEPEPTASGTGPAVTPIPAASANPTPAPVRAPVDIDIVKDHAAVFAHELKITWCAPAGVQMTLADPGPR